MQALAVGVQAALGKHTLLPIMLRKEQIVEYDPKSIYLLYYR
jgi:hypothetical protein